MDRDSFIVYIKTDDIYKDFVEDIETRFDTSNYELDNMNQIDHFVKKKMKK